MVVASSTPVRANLVESVLEDYKNALKAKENTIEQLYNEIKIIKKLRV